MCSKSLCIDQSHIRLRGTLCVTGNSITYILSKTIYYLTELMVFILSKWTKIKNTIENTNFLTCWSLEIRSSELRRRLLET